MKYLLLSFSIALFATTCLSTPGETLLASITSPPSAGSGYSYAQAISANGDKVVFISDSPNLVVGDTGYTQDVFVRDFASNTTTRVNVSSAGAPSIGSPSSASISGDGRFVVFDSNASTLVPGDTGGFYDVFLRDMVLGTTTRVSTNSAGVAGNWPSSSPSISTDGRFVAFESGANNLVSGDTNLRADVFVKDLQTGTTTRVSRSSSGVQGNGDSFRPAISGDGRFVAFESNSTNFGFAVGFTSICLHDRVSGTTELISVNNAGVSADLHSQYPKISDDGRFVVFTSTATNLGLIIHSTFLRDRHLGTTTGVSGGSNIHISRDGQWMAFDPAGDIFTFCYARRVDQMTWIPVSISSSGQNGNGFSSMPIPSDDGRFFAFESTSTNLSEFPGDGVSNQVYRHERPIVGTEVSGNMSLSDFVGSTQGGLLRVEVWRSSNLVETVSFSISTPNQFQVMLTTTGAVSLKFKYRSGLKKSVVLALNGSPIYGVNVGLANGDADSSGEVDAADIDQVIGDFGDLWPGGTGNALSDLDGSGEVDAADIDVAIANFGSIDD